MQYEGQTRMTYRLIRRIQYGGFRTRDALFVVLMGPLLVRSLAPADTVTAAARLFVPRIAFSDEAQQSIDAIVASLRAVHAHPSGRDVT